MILSLDHAVIPMVDRMQSTGLLISPAFFSAFSRELAEMLEAKQAYIDALVGRYLNPLSSLQVGALLFDEYQLDGGRRTRHGNWQCDDKVLTGLSGDNPEVAILDAILDYREVYTLKTRYVDRIPLCADPDGRVRPELKLTRVPTGRLAASHPRKLNLLAIPTRTKLGKRVRQGFVAPPGRVILSIDLDQIEMRVTASESGDVGMIELFWCAETDPKNPENDIHRISGRDCFQVPLAAVTADQRQVGKTVGFGMLNDMAAPGLMDQFRLYNIWKDALLNLRYTDAEAAEFIRRWHEGKPGVTAWKDELRAHARRYGYVDDMWGRRRYCPQIVSSLERIRSEGLREIVNHPIQAGAQGIIKTGMALSWADWGAWEGLAEPLLQIHDELLIEVDRGVADGFGEWMKDRLAHAGDGKMCVPVGSKYGYAECWGEIKK